MNDFGLTDAELFPLLDKTSRENLRRLREHPHAPRYNWRTGERLTTDGLANVRAYAQRVKAERPVWRAGELPPWVMPFVERCRREVPFYREQKLWAENDLLSIPLTRREDIRRHPWSFVPDGQRIENLITYTTSATTGTCLQIPATPELPNKYLPLIEQSSFECWRSYRGWAQDVNHPCLRPARYGGAVLHQFLPPWRGIRQDQP
jgi:phenylacetate-CoA ligase